MDELLTDLKRNNALENKQAFQVINFNDVQFENPHPDVHVARILISSASWVLTSDGVVLVDTLLHTGVSTQMRDKILETGGPIKKIIYTHHHVDHVGGAQIFEADSPEIIAHQYLPESIEKYEILKEHRARIASIQFNIPPDTSRFAALGYLPPTRTFSDSMVFTQGDKTFPTSATPSNPPGLYSRGHGPWKRCETNVRNCSSPMGDVLSTPAMR